jgi:tRNA A-37 threonylcarbamoyl transferase component Bud32
VLATTDDTPQAPPPKPPAPARRPKLPRSTPAAVAAPTNAADRNLLFGALALQAALIDNSQFAEACASWVTRKETPLADLLTERGWLTAAGREEVDRLVERHLNKHKGDLRVGLGALIGEELQHTLSAIGDDDLQHSLADLASGGHVGMTTVDEVGGTRRRYTLVRLHARGGIGQVWVARDPDLGRDVALKELQPKRADDPASWQRFLLEAQITGQLEHPGIVPVYELVRATPGEQAFYTMRFVRGRTLHAAIRDYHRRHGKGRTGKMDRLALLQTFISVCNAIAYAHARGVVHRDLKGLNVVLDGFGEVVVLDWGLAKLVDRPEEEHDLPAVTVEGARRTSTTGAGSCGTRRSTRTGPRSKPWPHGRRLPTSRRPSSCTSASTWPSPGPGGLPSTS